MELNSGKLCRTTHQNKLFCEDCKEYYVDECPRHGPPKFIKDSIPEKVSPCRVLHTLPPGLAAGPSLAQVSRIGIWCVGQALQKGIFFGPVKKQLKYSGSVEAAEDEGDKIDGLDNTQSLEEAVNWMKFACSARSEEEQNVAVFQFHGKLHFRVLKVIEPGMELLLGPEEGRKDSSEEGPCSEDAVASLAQENCSVNEKCGTPEKLALQGVDIELEDDGPQPLLGPEEEEVVRVPLKRPMQFLSKNRKPEISAVRKKDLTRTSNCTVKRTVPENSGGNESCKLDSNESLPPVGPPKTPQDENCDDVSITQQSTAECRGEVVERTGGPRASSRLAAKPRKVHTLVSRIQKRLQERKLRVLEQQSKERHVSGEGKHETKLEEAATQEKEKEQDSLWEEEVSEETRNKTTAENGDNLVPHKEETSPQQQSPSQCKVQPEASHTAARERKYRCDECGKRFLQLCHLKKHKFTHLDYKPYLCTECGKSYSSQESFRAHLLFHKGERPFKCEQCEKAYGTKRDLKEHEILHTGQRPFVCDQCGKAYARRPSLRIHKEIHRMKELNLGNTKTCKCAVCDKELANPGSLRNHMRLHTGEKPFLCPYCGKSFRQQGNLRGHLRIHTGEKPYRCEYCNGYFSQLPELRRHLISHTGEAYLCPICGKALRDRHTLRAHEQLHTGDRPYKCDQCEKAYTLATKLRRHQKSHLEDKPYKCLTCGAGYTMRQSLLRHQSSHKRKEEKLAGELAEALAALESEHPPPSFKDKPEKKPRKPKKKKRRADQTESSSATEEPTVVYVHAFQTMDGASGVGQGTVMISTAAPHENSMAFSAQQVIHSVIGSSSDLPQTVQDQAGGHIQINEDIIEIIISDADNKCVMVGEKSQNNVVILQGDEGINAVAETVEIETGT